MISPKNIEELREAIELLLQDEDLCYKIGKNALIRVRENYALDVVMKQYQILWRS